MVTNGKISIETRITTVIVMGYYKAAAITITGKKSIAALPFFSPETAKFIGYLFYEMDRNISNENTLQMFAYKAIAQPTPDGQANGRPHMGFSPIGNLQDALQALQEIAEEKVKYKIFKLF
jgi:hypothetical protein